MRPVGECWLGHPLNEHGDHLRPEDTGEHQGVGGTEDYLDAVVAHANLMGYVWPAEPGAELGVWFDRDGHPIGGVGWSVRQGDDDYRCVAEHWVRGWRVSTVWTGMDGSHMPPSMRKGPPLIYETMLFAPPGSPVADAEDFELPPGASVEEARTAILALLVDRRISYATADEARAGHDEAVHALTGLLGARPAEVQTEAQHSGREWEVEAGGWRLIVQNGAMVGLVAVSMEAEHGPPLRRTMILPPY